MRIKFLKQLLWVVNVLLVLGVVGVVLKFFFLTPVNPKQARHAEDILGEIIQQGRRKINRDKPDPPLTYRNTWELAIFGAPPPPPVVEDKGPGLGPVPDLVRNYELQWTMLDPAGWGSYAHLAKLPARSEFVYVEVGEKVDGAWKLIRVGLDDAEFEDEASGNTVTLTRNKVDTTPLNTGGDNVGGPQSPPDLIDPSGKPLTPEQDFARGPIKAALRKSENHWESPPEEVDWLGRHGEEVANQVALQPEKDPETGRPAGVRVTKVEQNSWAQKRGLLPGDVVKSINGNPVNSRQDAISYLKGPGKDLNRYVVVIERKGRLITLTYDVRK